MAARRRVVEFEMSETDQAALLAISRSRTEKAGWVVRARMLLGYRETRRSMRWLGKSVSPIRR
jgi:hypothetical protein